MHDTALKSRSFFVPLGLLLIFFLLVVILWSPNGLNVPPTFDEWNLYVGMDRWSLDLEPFPFDKSRPLSMIWVWIVFSISPDSMLAPNWFIMLALLVKAVSFYVIAVSVFRHRGMAVAAACLINLIPIDYGVYEKGTFPLQIADSLYFTAVAFFITHRNRFNLWNSLILWLTLVVICGTYDNVYPLMALTPLVLLIGQRHITRRHLRISLLWWSVPFLGLIILVLPTLATGMSYQNRMISPDVSLRGILDHLVAVYRHVLVRGWQEAIQRDIGQVRALQVVVGAFAGGVIWLISRRQPAIRFSTWCTAIVCGLILIGAGCAMYLPTKLLVDGRGSRVYYLSVAGASLIAVSTAWSISRLLRSTLIFGFLSGVFIAIALGGTLNIIYKGTLTRSTHQGQILSSLMIQAPLMQPNTVIIFLFTNSNDSPFTSADMYLHNAVTYLYRDYSLKVYTCDEEQCPLSVWARLAAAETVVFRVEPAFDVTLLRDVPQFDSSYQPERRINTGALLPSRFTTIYTLLDF